MAAVYKGSVPSIARETGAIRKKWKNRLPIALLFPNSYLVGMSNLGLQQVYALLNRQDDIVCERFFVPTGGQALRSQESNRPLGDFPVLFSSFSFEADFPNFVHMLRHAAIPLRAKIRRGDSGGFGPGRPLVVGGGVATLINPEPIAPFVDLFFLGELEDALSELLAQVRGILAAGKHADQALARCAGSLAGSYVPALYEPTYGEDGELVAVATRAGAPLPVAKRVVPALATSAHSTVLSPDTTFADIFLTELGRGCSRACRFCAAGYVYRPPRLWSATAIANAIARRPKECRRIGLLGMEMARPEELGQLADSLLATSCALSFSSLRADALGKELTALLAASGLKSAAIAPDGASERLRQVINKGISRQDVLQAAVTLAEIGVRSIKLYFMIGLPTETMDDLAAMVDLVEEVRQKIRPVGRRRRVMSEVVLSVNSFVPKAWTPFQFHPMMPVARLRRRLTFLRQKVKAMANVRMRADKPENALWQAVLSRGDRRLALVLEEMATGTPWRTAMGKHRLDSAWYAGRARGLEELLPWEIVGHKVTKRYLWQEYQRALAGRSTPSCTPESCRRCGVCPA